MISILLLGTGLLPDRFEEDFRILQKELIDVDGNRIAGILQEMDANDIRRPVVAVLVKKRIKDGLAHDLIGDRGILGGLVIDKGDFIAIDSHSIDDPHELEIIRKYLDLGVIDQGWGILAGKPAGVVQEHPLAVVVIFIELILRESQGAKVVLRFQPETVECL